ncbi:hypothetical protein [Halalkalibacter urbisdiaboli]|uniref:hypothetical protein n=1 Tax=Halalkalibacter urbisdiaboli TaxID=1960589 RepID=UPI000B448C1E|nr:hypothetical protein [Halalkalibacter urbisdiaboli]
MRIKVKIEAHSFLHGIEDEKEANNSVKVKIIPIDNADPKIVAIPHSCDSKELPLDSLIYSALLKGLFLFKTMNPSIEIEDIELDFKATHADFYSGNEAEPVDKSQKYLKELKIAIDGIRKVQI